MIILFFVQTHVHRKNNGILQVFYTSNMINCLEKVGLQGYEKKKISKCSGGEQQRIALARLLIKPCELVLADEPTGSLDDENKQIVLKLLKELQSDGKTIVMVTHDKELEPYANRIIEI